jgi:hypothetical protein
MGVHYVKDALVRDGQLDPERPKALLYEMRNGKLFLIAASRPSTHCTSGPGATTRMERSWTGNPQVSRDGFRSSE